MRVKPRPNGKLLTLKAAEIEYAIPYSRLREWVLTGKLPRLDESLSGRTFQVRRTDLDALVNENMTVTK